MEYLVTMTTRVPRGTSEDDVADVREREAAHTSELAREGRVLRLWRPPLAPGEWRTIGLFSTSNLSELEQILGAMPLRVWRTDEVVALGPHPNDPPFPTSLRPRDAEFFTTFVLTIPADTSSAAIDSHLAREAERTRELANEGRLIRLWSLPGHGRNLGHWQAKDEQGMQTILRSLPMADWLRVATVRLSRHPSDPATEAKPNDRNAVGARPSSTI